MPPLWRSRKALGALHILLVTLQCYLTALNKVLCTIVIWRTSDSCERKYVCGQHCFRPPTRLGMSCFQIAASGFGRRSESCYCWELVVMMCFFVCRRPASEQTPCPLGGLRTNELTLALSLTDGAHSVPSCLLTKLADLLRTQFRCCLATLGMTWLAGHTQSQLQLYSPVQHQRMQHLC